MNFDIQNVKDTQAPLDQGQISNAPGISQPPWDFPNRIVFSYPQAFSLPPGNSQPPLVFPTPLETVITLGYLYPLGFPRIK